MSPTLMWLCKLRIEGWFQLNDHTWKLHTLHWVMARRDAPGLWHQKADALARRISQLWTAETADALQAPVRFRLPKRPPAAMKPGSIHSSGVRLGMQPMA